MFTVAYCHRTEFMEPYKVTVGTTQVFLFNGKLNNIYIYTDI